jgi:signal transduction histidine kinase/ActR/RegA family two-component response regulator
MADAQALTLEQIGTLPERDPGSGSAPGSRAPWRSLSLAAQVYVATIILAGTAVLVMFFPRTLPQPVLFLVLTWFAGLTSVWKVNLPIPVTNGSTLSVSYAANLMSLLLLGPRHAVLIALAGALIQCRYKAKQLYPVYRTVFSSAAAVITMSATGAVYGWLGGVTPIESFAPARPFVGAIATYFLLNTGLIAGAIALSSRRAPMQTWRQDFLWSGASFMVAGTAGALAALVVQRGEHWKAVLLVAPIYLTYRTYELFAGRLDDQKRHTEEIQRLHSETVAALGQTRAAERALAEEKERLAVALAEMTRLEEHRNQLLEREQAARASAEDANRLKDQFLAIVSHELRTPLNSILGWGEMLSTGSIEPSLRDRALRGIRQSARRQAHLIDDLLDVARITTGKMRLERAFIDLRDVVRDALLAAQPSANEKNIRIGFDADPWIRKVFGDAARLQQVASNLISNALKFTPEGGVVHVRLRRAGNNVEMIVTDTGQGIAPEFLSSVFDVFRQADGSTTRMHSGLGLGLSIVKSLVEAHNGTVTVHSAGHGRGATFVVRLPIALPEESLEATSSDATAIAERRGQPLPSLEGISVLVVDDDEQSRDVVAAQLKGCGAAVVTAASAAQAFDMLQREDIGVLLADIGMPDEDGYTLIRRVRAMSTPGTASIPAAALTAFARDEDRQQALNAGYQLHLPKPLDASSLISAVATLGRMRPAADRPSGSR